MNCLMGGSKPELAFKNNLMSKWGYLVKISLFENSIGSNVKITYCYSKNLQEIFMNISTNEEHLIFTWWSLNKIRMTTDHR